MFLRRSLAHISYVYMIIFFLLVYFGGLPPPPHTKKLAMLLYGRVPLSHPPLGVQYTLYLTTERVPPPLVLKSYTFGGFLELELMLILT